MVQASAVRLLVVDDDYMMRDLVRRSLERLGYSHIFDAKDGLEGLTIARERLPHIIISDYSMPRMDGIELIEAIRADPVLGKVGFVLLSGVADEATVRRAFELGVNSYIVKPFSMADLRSRMEAVFEQISGSTLD
jgi:two-component system, chemotaxis family, chemotaxis protein CheY